MNGCLFLGLCVSFLALITALVLEIIGFGLISWREWKHIKIATLKRLLYHTILLILLVSSLFLVDIGIHHLFLWAITREIYVFNLMSLFYLVGILLMVVSSAGWIWLPWSDYKMSRLNIKKLKLNIIGAVIAVVGFLLTVWFSFLIQNYFI